MKIFQIVVGFIAGGLFLGVFQQHGFWQAVAVTFVYQILIYLLYNWFVGNFDKTETDELIKKEKSKWHTQILK